MIFLSISTVAALGVTIGLIAVMIGFNIIINNHVKKQEKVKVSTIILYLVDVIMLLGFLALILYLFGYDYETELANIWNNLDTGIANKFGAIVGTGLTAFIAMFIVKAANMLLKRTSSKDHFNRKRVQTIIKVTGSIIKYIVYVIALLVILSLWDVNVMPALASLGILGIIVGMGTQSLIKDFIAGFFIVFEHHFDVGDIVEINGWKGEVIDIGLKSTKVKNWKQDIKIFSNGSIDDAINYSLSPSTAIIDFGIAYKEDIQKTIDILKAELPKYREMFAEIIEDPMVLGVTELANSSVNLRVIIRTETEKHYAIERAIRQGIKEILDKNNIEIPFPQVVVHKPEE
mgnify:CR=1 FL=1